MAKKTVTVAVQIQMDIIEGDEALPQVQDTLEFINNAISAYSIDGQPQIFISDISNSDIIENEDEEEDEY